MKITNLAIITMTALFVLGCGFLGGSGMSLKYNGKETSIEPKAAFIHSVPGGVHTIHITSYPVEMGERFSFPKLLGRESGQFRIALRFMKEKSSGAAPVVPGGYKPQHHSETPKDKFIAATIHHFEDGKEVPYELDYKTQKGVINITSVEGDTVKGTIDVSDEKTAIKGEFTAKAFQ